MSGVILMKFISYYLNRVMHSLLRVLFLYCRIFKWEDFEFVFPLQILVSSGVWPGAQSPWNLYTSVPASVAVLEIRTLIRVWVSLRTVLQLRAFQLGKLHYSFEKSVQQTTRHILPVTNQVLSVNCHSFQLPASNSNEFIYFLFIITHTERFKVTWRPIFSNKKAMHLIPS
jgi:hypothetical protein